MVGCIRVTHPSAGRHQVLLLVLPLDLHVLSLPLAFILSQDQTLLCNYLSFYLYFLVCPNSFFLFLIYFGIFVLPFLLFLACHLVKDLLKPSLSVYRLSRSF